MNNDIQNSGNAAIFPIDGVDFKIPENSVYYFNKIAMFLYGGINDPLFYDGFTINIIDNGTQNKKTVKGTIVAKDQKINDMDMKIIELANIIELSTGTYHLNVNYSFSDSVQGKILENAPYGFANPVYGSKIRDDKTFKIICAGNIDGVKGIMMLISNKQIIKS